MAKNPEDHLDDLIARQPRLAACRADIASAFRLLRASFRRGRKTLLCGNGGSAADADHWSGELLKGFMLLRPLDAKARKGLPRAIAARLQGGLPAIPLTGFTALGTAFGNDVDPELTFAQLVSVLGKRGDVFVALSTSGNSRNVLAAARVASSRGLAVIGLTGARGGALRKLCKVCIRVPAGETTLVQEFHLPVYHCLSLMLETEFFG